MSESEKRMLSEVYWCQALIWWLAAFVAYTRGYMLPCGPFALTGVFRAVRSIQVLM